MGDECVCFGWICVGLGMKKGCWLGVFWYYFGVWWWLGNIYDCVYFYFGVFGQSGYVDGCMGWVGFLEVFFYDFVDLIEMIQVGEKDVQFDDVVQGVVGGVIDCVEIIEDMLYLSVYVVVDQFYGGWVQWDLVGKINGGVGFDGLGVWIDGGGCLIGFDYGMVGYGVVFFRY